MKCYAAASARDKQRRFLEFSLVSTGSGVQNRLHLALLGAPFENVARSFVRGVRRQLNSARI
jgi:hypothetical protein